MTFIGRQTSGRPASKVPSTRSSPSVGAGTGLADRDRHDVLAGNTAPSSPRQTWGATQTRSHFQRASGRCVQDPGARRAENRAGAPRRSDGRRRSGAGPGTALAASTNSRRDRRDGALRSGVEPDLQAAEGGGAHRRADPGPGRRPLDSIRQRRRCFYPGVWSRVSSRAVACSQSNRIETNSRPCRAMRSRRSWSSTSRASARANAPTSRRGATMAVRPSKA